LDITNIAAITQKHNKILLFSLLIYECFQFLGIVAFNFG